jgi:hypothetical protein
MHIRKVVLIPLLGALLLSGCAQPQELYNYNDYSDKYYSFKKDVSEESALNLQNSIEQAIEESAKSRSGRVPPGMYANLGYLYLKGGSPQQAINNFEKEKSVYPESAHFMDRIIAKVELAEGAEK